MKQNTELLTITKALADRNRLLLIAALMRNHELCACRLTEFLGVSGATTSRHLALLVNAGLLVSQKKGRWIYFSINEKFDQENHALMEWLKQELDAGFLTENEISRLEMVITMDEEELCRRQQTKDCK